MILQTTLSLAAAAAIINLWLAIRTGKLRFDSKVLHGDGGKPMLQQRMRAQANFVEYTPFVLILIAAIELTGKGGTWLAVVGSIYMLARVAHGFGMDRTDSNPLRAGGFIVTVLTLAGLSAVAVTIALGGM
ncbi:putative membrane protein YecN with MAPEG domain [Novosphingobium chloroacetimidivorans]|uniref:Putative membrane protein YecN with MAPEG domain n=1 Tax=Novosphingobium chloroacetimidivorans TaxID=1428314 RepID=A0A7W7NW13_9SPHN|nr:MAPEG family protein [Novosphingobium chloroacetimidivorans]MBB4859058.1 putative membrane protein YecN with MAPEG domain [Novosphingobium chloroacetimidivorans]